MRKVPISKNVIKKGAVAFGLTKGQIISVVVALACALATVSGIIVYDWNFDLTMGVAFLELVLIAGISIIKINGMPLIKYIFLQIFLDEDIRLYSSQGVFTRNEKKEK